VGLPVEELVALPMSALHLLSADAPLGISVYRKPLPNFYGSPSHVLQLALSILALSFPAIARQSLAGRRRTRGLAFTYPSKVPSSYTAPAVFTHRRSGARRT
jgi:hypothetical protein